MNFKKLGSILQGRSTLWQAYPAILDPGTEEPQPHLDTPPLLEELPEKLQLPSPEQEAILQEWCTTEEVGLPFIPVDSSDGEVKPLNDQELEELRSHISSGHLTKSNLCKGCLIAEGPRRIHQNCEGCRHSNSCPSHRYCWTADHF